MKESPLDHHLLEHYWEWKRCFASCGDINKHNKVHQVKSKYRGLKDSGRDTKNGVNTSRVYVSDTEKLTYHNHFPFRDNGVKISSLFAYVQNEIQRVRLKKGPRNVQR